MDFLKSQTALNLARSFAGESQARNRYTIFAEQARKETQEYLARIFDETADNEKIHAKEFYEMIQKLAGGPVNNIEFDAGYPYPLGNTVQNLQFAADGEQAEHESVYPEFARIAAEEGFTDAATLWKNIAVVEGLHHNVFIQAKQQLEDGSLYKKSQPAVWRCLNCGHVISALEPWDVCPICHKPTGWVEGDINKKQLP